MYQENEWLSFPIREDDIQQYQRETEDVNRPGIPASQHLAFFKVTCQFLEYISFHKSNMTVRIVLF